MVRGLCRRVMRWGLGRGYLVVRYINKISNIEKRTCLYSEVRTY